MPSYNSRRSAYNSKPRYGGNNSNRNRSRGNSRGPKKAYIHPSKLVNKARPVAEQEYDATHDFSDFALNELLHKNIADMGFEKPSPIQDKTIPNGLNGQDVVGIANTGTGKTAAFALPMLHRLMANPNSKALVLAPTRELAEQIEQQCKQLAKGSGLTGALLIGGSSMGKQLRDLRFNPQVIIGTPGRTKDHIERGTLDLSNCDIAVLDEVDRMLDMGFVNDITFILSRAKNDRQSLYFSATIDNRVKTIIDTFSNDPVHISVKSSETSDNVEQDVVHIGGSHEKLDKLHDILIQQTVTKTVIFDDTQRSVGRLAKELSQRGFKSGEIHGGKSQGQRQRVLQQFKDSKIDVLVATDVAARGLDVSDISHVINYSMPQTYDDYVHRIGRTGRAGSIGYALTFVER